MPIYNYRCVSCLAEEEVLLPMAKRNTTRIHSCGTTMERLISIPQPAIIRITNTDRVFKTLNRDDGFGFPDNKHTARYGKVITDSLNQEKPTIGIGF